MAVFALAHMSCAGAWAWGEVPSLLRAAGHEVVVPDLPLTPGVTPASHGEALAAAVRAALPIAAASARSSPAASAQPSPAADAGPPPPVVFAGHSYGSLVAAVAAGLVDGVAAFVVIDGFVPEDGRSAFDLRPGPSASRRAEAAERGDGCWTAGSPGPWAPSWWSRLEPMPVSAFEAPVPVASSVAALPSWFVWCRRSDFEAEAERARARGWTVVEVDADHALPLIDPARCAEVLVDALHSVRPPT
jgi:pimeloyl-ACP methyl ester carboxylesterase